MSFEIVQGDSVGRWIASRLEASFDGNSEVAIGLQIRGEMAAGVIYEQWNGKSVVCHIVFDRITRRFLGEAFRYAFDVCGASKIIGPVWSDNQRALGMVAKLGFREEARIRDATPEGDIVLMTMVREQCRFLEWGTNDNGSH